MLAKSVGIFRGVTRIEKLHQICTFLRVLGLIAYSIAQSIVVGSESINTKPRVLQFHRETIKSAPT